MKLDEVYTKFSKSLLGYIKSKINNKEDAEDILQNVFLKMQINISTLSDKEKVQHWLYRITRNTIIDYYRTNASKKKQLELKEKLSDNFEGDELNDTTKGLDKCLTGFINQLPAEYKSIIIDSEIKGIPQKELSAKYNLAYPTLRSRVQRGRERLHKMLVGCCAIQADVRGNILEASCKSDACESDCGAIG